MNKEYRTDIDVLRAIAIISVILFHLGFISNGYLGVDVFFVISGYLITGSIYSDIEQNTFSIFQFYEKRIRRIIPLVLFTTLIAFLLGMLFMLPNDLENLSQSVFATNFFANNVLMKITSANYWSVKNDYSPLMHTWSLGVEEQFYILYPLLFIFLRKEKTKWILPLLVVLTIVSVTAFFKSDNFSSKFYFIQYRFFELAIGGICAIYFSKKNCSIHASKSNTVLGVLIVTLIWLLFLKSINSNDIKILTTTILTASILALAGFGGYKTALYQNFFSNKILAGIGKISYSIYMWHQIVFAFSRYILVEEITLRFAILLCVVIVVLSIVTYIIIEVPFRNKTTIKTKPLCILLSCSFLIVTTASLYVYIIGGIIKDVPELGLYKSNLPKQVNFFSNQNNIHIQYNESIRLLDKPFTSKIEVNSIADNKVKILVLGNSLGRDMANIFLESTFKNSIEVSYSDFVQKNEIELTNRIAQADYIFFASTYPTPELIEKYNINMHKVWIVGPKDFGNCNGLHYNKKIANYTTYRTSMKKDYLEYNNKLKEEWGEKYIGLIGLISDSTGNVLVFSPDGKFISQDTLHFTKFGALFFAKLLDARLREILKLKEKHK